MRAALGLTACFVLGCLQASPARADGALRRGLAALADGNEAVADPNTARRFFAQAAGYFEQAKNQGFQSPALFLNLGNAYFLNDQLPEAIFAYRRGLRLDPHHRTLQTHLTHARQRVPVTPGIDPPEEPARPWSAWLRPLALICYLCGIPVLFWWGATRRREPALAAIGLILGCAVLEYLATYRETGRREWELVHPPVVIRAEKTPLRMGNGPSFTTHPTVPLLPAGQEGRRLLERGGWIQIEVPGGAVGWVPRVAVLMEEN